MKHKFFLLLAGLSLLVVQVKAQAPYAFNYQGVARNSSGQVLSNQAISLRFTIHKVSGGGAIVYQETQEDTTNQFGIFSVNVGFGTVVQGSFSTIAWGTSNYYLQVEMDPTGHTNYFDMGTQQLLSVPYALYSASSGGSSSLTGAAGSILYGTGTSAEFSSVGTAGEILESNGTNAPMWAPGSLAWELVGNPVAYGFSNQPVTYLGTTASGGAGFQFGVGGTNAGRVESTNGNTALGYQSLNTGGSDNTAVGYDALQKNTANNNIAVGYYAIGGASVSGSPLTAIGYKSLYSNTTGADNVALGYEALYLNVSTSYNTALGDFALASQYTATATKNTAVGFVADYSNSSGSDIVAVGDSALYTNSSSGNVAVGASALKANTGADNVAVGQNALQHNKTALGNTAVGYIALDANTTGASNTAMGAYAQYYNNTGIVNTSVGAYSLYSNTSGGDNVAIGYQALLTNTTGMGNTAIGYESNVASGTLTNATAIGANSVVGESNALVLGGTGNNAVNVGINTTTPNSSLQIFGGNVSLPIVVSATSVNLSTSPNTYTVIITATGQTVTLPAASSCPGRVYVIVAQFASGSIATSSFLNFGGSATTSVAAQGGVTIQSDGTNWDMIK